MLNEINLFPPFIWKFKYNFNLDLLREKIDYTFGLVKENSHLEKGNAVSTVSLGNEYQPHTWLELQDFQNYLGSQLEIIKDTYVFMNRMSRVGNSWMNRHYRTGYTEEHAHSATILVASCYLKAPANSGNIVFKNPLEYHLTNFPLKSDEYLYREVPVESGDVLIFPGFLRHYVQPNQTDEERLVMTLNIS